MTNENLVTKSEMQKEFEKIFKVHQMLASEVALHKQMILEAGKFSDDRYKDLEKAMSVQVRLNEQLTSQMKDMFIELGKLRGQIIMLISTYQGVEQ